MHIAHWRKLHYTSRYESLQILRRIGIDPYLRRHIRRVRWRLSRIRHCAGAVDAGNYVDPSLARALLQTPKGQTMKPIDLAILELGARNEGRILRPCNRELAASPARELFIGDRWVLKLAELKARGLVELEDAVRARLTRKGWDAVQI